jgi:hypothetical protein
VTLLLEVSEAHRQVRLKPCRFQNQTVIPPASSPILLVIRIFIGPNYRIVKTFADSSEVLELGLGLLDLYNIIGIETGKVTPSDLDQTLADEAIERMNHLFQFGVYDDNDQCDPNN